MEEKFVKILIVSFSDIPADEIKQAIRIAEFQDKTQPKLVFTRVRNACLDKLRKLTRERRLFLPLHDLTVDKEPATIDKERDRRERWMEILSTMPRNARKLAEIAEDVATNFVPYNNESVWSTVNRSKMIAIIRKRFISWEKSHTHEQYLKARRQLLRALNRAERRG